MENGECTSSLLFGIQWDLALKYIETRGTPKSNLTQDSTTVGNYFTSELELNRGKFAQYNLLSNWYAYNSEEKIELVTKCKKKTQNTDKNAIILTTGATEKTNILQEICGNGH